MSVIRIAALLLLAFGCAERPSLEEREWTLVELGGSGISALEGLPLPSLRLMREDGAMTGFSGCNRIFGAYRLDGDELRFGPIGATRRACPDEHGLEGRFLEALEKTTLYSYTAGALEFRQGDVLLARFVLTESE